MAKDPLTGLNTITPQRCVHVNASLLLHTHRFIRSGPELEIILMDVELDALAPPLIYCYTIYCHSAGITRVCGGRGFSRDPAKQPM